MIHTKTIACFTLMLAAAPALLAQKYTIDASHSKAQFAVRHMMVSTVRGEFSKMQGWVEYDEKKPEAIRIEATIDAASINTGEPKRDEHLKSPDFFDVAKFPSITFRSKSAKKTPNGLAVTGDLTMHGVTREVVLNVEGPSPEVRDPWGNYRRGATATTKINRKDFGLTWNALLETGGVAVGEEVSITIDVEAVRPAEKK
ncbi:MAG: YceI family protein [Bryobacteraceae bacterium]|nr:YceI family protein [Bryobacteraceae bacterium]MCX7603417.1 YceI family protein [Bryobacteraceae bacterium]